MHFVTYSIFKNVKITTYSVFLHKIHNRENQMAYGKRCGEEDGQEVFPVGGKEDERQAGRDSQQEDEDGAHIGREIEHPSDVIDCDTNNCGND